MASGSRLTLEDQWQSLREHRDHEPRPYVRQRHAAILKSAGGQSPLRVAGQGLLREREPDTVYLWLTAYQTAGLPGCWPSNRAEEVQDQWRQAPGEAARQAVP